MVTTPIRKRNSGQVLVLAAIGIVALLAAVGLALDGGNLYAQRRQAQNAADAAALAGARVLSTGDRDNAHVWAELVKYATDNKIPDAANHLNGNYVDQDGKSLGAPVQPNGQAPSDAYGVEVTVDKTTSTYFMRIVGTTNFKVQGFAAARSKPSGGGGGGNTAVFAHNMQRSDAIKTTGPDYIIKGNVHSNAGITNSGGGYQVTGEVEFVTGTTGVDRWAIQSTTNGAVQSTVQDYPVNFKTSDFAPGSAEAVKSGASYHYIQGDLTLIGNMAPGLYYVEGNVKGSSKFNASNVTIIARGTIDISSPESTLTAFTQHIALMSDAGGSAIHISSGGYSKWDGLIFSPNGAINFSMPNGAMIGGLIGDTIDITGPNANITGAYSGPPGPNSPGEIALYQ